MKSVTLAVCLIAASAFAQDRPPAQQIADSARQPTSIVSAKIAEHDQADPAIVRLKGDVQIASGGSIVKADEAVVNMDTGEIEPLGNVRVKLITQ